MVAAQNLWLHDALFNAFMKNGFSKINGNKSWEITDLQILFLTPDLSKGFLQLTELPIYKNQAFDLEIKMINENAKKIANEIGNEPFNLVDIWCGSGLKAVEFVKALNKASGKNLEINYCPVNASSYLSDLAIDNVKKANLPNKISYRAFLSSGDGSVMRDIGKEIRKEGHKKNVLLLLGTVLACYEINSYLFEISREMKKGDILVLGNGVRFGERLVEIDKYKNKAFHDWFKHLIYGMGIDEKDVEFDVRFGNSRVEFFYKIKKAYSTKVNGKMIVLSPGDELVVAVLYKYFSYEFENFCNLYFEHYDMNLNKDGGYALVTCVK